VAARPRQRPYYHVSEEEYRLNIQILKHYLPDEDLNLETLRSIAKGLKSGSTPPEQTHDPNARKESPENDATGSNESEPDTEEIGDLHEQLGCLMKDSLGEYRWPP